MNNEGKIFYFMNNSKISFCPFIKYEDKCKYFEENFNIIEKENGNFENSYEKCDINKKIMNQYCITNCSNGYGTKGTICHFCDLYEGHYFNYGTKECSSICNSNYSSNYTCYNCKEVGQKYYDNKCHENCGKVYGFDFGDNTCKPCKDNGTYYSFDKNKCIEEDECKAGIIDYQYNFCYECIIDNQIFFPNNTCVNSCEPLFVEDNNICKIFKDKKNNTFYEEGACVEKCNKTGYGLYDELYKLSMPNKTTKEINIKYCTLCRDIKNGNNGLFVKNGVCETECGSGYFIKDTYLICDTCKNDEYYDEKNTKCIEKCPENSRPHINKTCIYCTEDEYYYEKGDIKKCLQTCDQNITYIKENNTILYKKCVYCEENGQNLIDGKCLDNCNDNYYLFTNNICYKCFCGNEAFNCYDNSSQCNCFNSSNYYG